MPSQFTVVVSLLNISVRFCSETLLSTYLINLCISLSFPSSIGASKAAAAASALLAAGDFQTAAFVSFTSSTFSNSDSDSSSTSLSPSSSPSPDSSP
jgi:hypothetical protein